MRNAEPLCKLLTPIFLTPLNALTVWSSISQQRYDRVKAWATAQSPLHGPTGTTRINHTGVERRKTKRADTLPTWSLVSGNTKGDGSLKETQIKVAVIKTAQMKYGTQNREVRIGRVQKEQQLNKGRESVSMSTLQNIWHRRGKWRKKGWWELKNKVNKETVLHCNKRKRKKNQFGKKHYWRRDYCRTENEF